MKRWLLIFVAVYSWQFLAGQTFIWEEFTANQVPPPGWTIDNFANLWSARYSNNAGGSAPEADFSSINQTGTSRLISPVIDLTGFDSVMLGFRHKYHDYTGAGPRIGVATRSAGGSWKMVWQLDPVNNIPATLEKITIKNTDVGSTSFQFCLYASGNFFNFWDWWIDDILLYNPLDLDAGLTLLNTPQYLGGATPVNGQFRNFGNSTVTDITINWTLDNGPVQSTDFTGLSIDTLETYDFTCNGQINTSLGDHQLVVWIEKVNGIKDQYSGDDTMAMQIRRVSHTEPYRPLYEEFTSATCLPCAFFNTDFVPWCEEHDSGITLLKYQMDWPPPGDPYYTPEAGSRRNYYGVIFVPDLYVGGAQYNTDMNAVMGAFATSQQKQGLGKIAASFTMNPPNIHVTATVLPFDQMDNVIIHAIVFERLTNGNVMNNGETEFQHVMMKMVPDSLGTMADLSDRTPFTIDQTVDMTGTHVEQYPDLGVAVFIQDSVSKYVFQSGYAVRNKVFGDEARLTSISMNTVPLAGFDPDILTYDVDMPGGTTDVPDITAVPMDTNATVIIIPAMTIPGTTAIDVFAENLVDHKTYTVSFNFPVGDVENPQHHITVWPNPSRGTVHLDNAGGAKVTVCSAAGREVMRIERLQGNTIDLGQLSKGVYILTVERPGETPVRKKVVLI